MSAVETLIGLAHPDMQDTCSESEQVYDTELASITCGPDDLPFELSLFASFPELAAAYTDDVSGAETPPAADGSCEQGNYEGGYGTEGVALGRVNCREHTSSDTGAMYHVIEWTNDDQLVIGYISNRVDAHSWQELIDFWSEQSKAIAR